MDTAGGAADRMELAPVARAAVPVLPGYGRRAVVLRYYVHMLTRLFRHFRQDELGQDLVEYAFLLACIALTVIVGMRSLGAAVNSKYAGASTTIAAAAAGGGNGNNGNNGNNGSGNNGNGNNGNGNNGNGNGNNGGGKNP